MKSIQSKSNSSWQSSALAFRKYRPKSTNYPLSTTIFSSKTMIPVLLAVWQQLVLETLVLCNASRNNRGANSRFWSRQKQAASSLTQLPTLASPIPVPTRTANGTTGSHNKVHCELQGLVERIRGSQHQNHSVRATISSSTTRSMGGTTTAESNPAIVQSSATSVMDPTATNNQAEYRGLMAGLESNWHESTIMGTEYTFSAECATGTRAPKSVKLSPL